MRGLCEKSKKVKRLKIQHKKKRKSIKKEVNFDDTLAEIPAKKSLLRIFCKEGLSVIE